MSIEYFITVFIICLSPGIGVIYTLSATPGGGWKAGFWASVGCTIATIIHLMVVMAGLAAVLHTSAVLFQTIKFSGVAYLLWMAWTVLNDRGGLSVRPVTSVTSMRLISRGILLNILNPKLPLFFMAFIPQFVPTGSSPTLLVELGMVFTIMTFTVFMGYVALASTGRQRVLQSATTMNWLRRSFSASFAALGLKLATEST
ncbi:LysE family transporter [Salmonella enterica subsp. enterica serovar Worthington]|uniref:LysE family translocator n=1 Tax=Salmonella enterica subsp. enterica serovar Ank TaxID=1173578 RepID=A0A5I2X901_SALET|nr:LysE family translocator [Salmonella enterica]EBS1327502.1 LysE family translocator [Salmonella enterica subsp. enterica serovar Muenchen]EBY9282908.1 LysE family translocator [Salmonella enterica subsp. enterica serovar Denver]ECF3886816.1 LysE family translocator [Salmonella enterica subsp. enterica serovar Ank]EGI5051749.1 LysE family transporter [Salmonella enterica subsp. enterica serovar Worthington]ECD5428030.1 LysE family translocator [Salmonella enterica subsp. enterica serovar Den